MSVAKKELFKAIKAFTQPGSKRTEALKQAQAFGIKKGATGKIYDKEAERFLKELSNRRLLKGRVGENGMSSSGKTGAQLREGMLGEKREEKSWSEIKAERAAEKKAAMESVNARRAEIDSSRAAAVQAATAKSYIKQRAEEDEREKKEGDWERHRAGINDRRAEGASALEPGDPAKAIDLPVD